MFAAKRNIDSTGNDSINSTGDGANFEINHYTSSVKILNKTYLYGFCVKFSEVEDTTENYDIEIASNIEDKMDYNEITLYKEIFFDCDYYIDDVEAILEEIPRRQRILSKINNKYKRFKMFEKWDNKDELCELVYKDLYRTIENDQSSGDMYLEDAELAIQALMYYSFTKCKLLDPIPKDDR